MDAIKFWIKIFKRDFAFCGLISMILNLLIALTFFDLSIFFQIFRLRHVFVGAIALTIVFATLKTIQSFYVIKNGNHKTELG